LVRACSRLVVGKYSVWDGVVRSLCGPEVGRYADFEMPNRLALSSSPYLRQHAENPVDWQEWGEAAWDEARQKNKPVFLSVGYSSCHWCHVMAHESFEDLEVAEMLNRDFVCIKLDREERPDIDDLYMTAVQLATGRGGWPMSVFLTPEGKPFFAGTYFPKNGRGENPGLLQILAALAGAWREEEAEIRRKSEEFAQGLRQVLERTIPPVTDRIDVGLVDGAVRAMREDFDEVNGGFGGAPKFPPFAALRFLMRYIEVRAGLPGDAAGLIDTAVYMVMRTLEQMALGGIRDHVGGGFHRYSTDAQWHLPHFEKMLSDNGQMLWLYARAARMVDDEELKGLFEEVTDGIVGWLEREMRVGDVYAAALDADTDGEEGLTYLWKRDEVSDGVADVYGFESGGNFRDEATGAYLGLNLLARQSIGWRLDDLDEMLERRLDRQQPGRDDKALLAWNALVISGLVEAGRLDLATRVAEFFVNYGAELPHQWVEGHESVGGFLDDFAYFGMALVDLGRDAALIVDRMVDEFADQRGFYFTGREHEELIGRQKPFLDQAVPSANGVAIGLLRRVGRNDEALEHLTAAYGWAQRAPQAAATILLECLEQLVLGRQVTSPIAGQGTAIEAWFDPSPLQMDPDGWAYAHLVVRIPDGFHINSNDPGADWLIPLSVAVDGGYAEVSFPGSETGQLSGMVEIGIRVQPVGQSGEFVVRLGYQLCSDSECYRPDEIEVKGHVVGVREG
jgi:uncharacterized protein